MTAPNLTIALASGTGGIAPSLIHLAQGYIKSNPDLPGIFYFIGVAIFFGLGAVVAIFFAETNPKKAFFLGIGLPALIATAQTQGSPKTAFLEFWPSAYAQTSAAAQPSRSAPSILDFKAAASCDGCELWFSNADGKVISKKIIGPSSAAESIQIPTGATTVGVADPKTNFKPVPIPKKPDSTITLEFNRKYSPWNDLRRGLGAYDLKSYDAIVEMKATQK